MVVRHRGLNNLTACPLSTLVTSASLTNLLHLTCSFPVRILNVSILLRLGNKNTGKKTQKFMLFKRKTIFIVDYRPVHKIA